MPAVAIQRLRTELELLYKPPFGAVATWRKIRQVMDELERVSGVKKTSDLRPPAVAAWVAAFPARKPATAFTLLSSLRRACSYAKSQGWLKSSPFEFRAIPDWLRDYDPEDQADDPAQRHHSLADLSRVLSHLAGEASKGWEYHRLFALALATAETGARAREIQCSLVADFDLAGRIFSVRPNDRRRLKTRRSKRRVPLPAEVVAALDDWLPLTGSIWAFPGSRRRSPWAGGSPGRKPLDRLKAAGLACGLPNLTFLSLRHSYLTHASGPWGIPDLISQKIAGHTQRKTTEGYRGFDRANALAAVESISFGITRPKTTEGIDGKAASAV